MKKLALIILVLSLSPLSYGNSFIVSNATLHMEGEVAQMRGGGISGLPHNARGLWQEHQIVFKNRDRLFNIPFLNKNKFDRVTIRNFNGKVESGRRFLLRGKKILMAKGGVRYSGDNFYLKCQGGDGKQSFFQICLEGKGQLSMKSYSVPKGVLQAIRKLFKEEEVVSFNFLQRTLSFIFPLAHGREKKIAPQNGGTEEICPDNAFPLEDDVLGSFGKLVSHLTNKEPDDALEDVAVVIKRGNFEVAILYEGRTIVIKGKASYTPVNRIAFNIRKAKLGILGVKKRLLKELARAEGPYLEVRGSEVIIDI